MTTWQRPSPAPRPGCATATCWWSPARWCQMRGPHRAGAGRPEERDALRRSLIDDEAIRVLARKGRTLITETGSASSRPPPGWTGQRRLSRIGLAASRSRWQRRALRNSLQADPGVEVAVVITDTMGRAWRNGQTDAAIGSAGLPVLYGYAGAVDGHGNGWWSPRSRSPTDRRGRRSGQGQADRGSGRRGARAGAARRRLDRGAPAARRGGRPVLAGHRGVDRTRPPPGYSAVAPVGAAVRPNPSRRS